MDASRFDSLSDEVMAKARACTTPDELIELADSQGISLTLDELDMVAGGVEWPSSICFSDGPGGIG